LKIETSIFVEQKVLYVGELRVLASKSSSRN